VRARHASAPADQSQGGNDVLHKHALDALQARHGRAVKEGGGHCVAFSYFAMALRAASNQPLTV
jgi:hypothetical protein